MILPEFILTSRQNKIWTNSGMDTFDDCFDKKHFKNYPFPITYNYNSRGFRDTEWPTTINELKECIWCFGDSFTVGIGSPIEHTWVNLLQSQCKLRCINVSLDGASNKWIARKVIDVLKIIAPKLIVIQWSYINRDEIANNTLTDEDRRLKFAFENINQLKTNNYKLLNAVELQKNQCKIIHSFIPHATCLDSKHILAIWNEIKGDSWPDLPKNLMEFNCLSKNIITELNDFFNVYELFISYYQLIDCITYIPEIVQLDWARDGHHYDIITATTFVDQLENLISDLQLT